LIIKHQQQSMYFQSIAIHDGMYHASLVSLSCIHSLIGGGDTPIVVMVLIAGNRGPRLVLLMITPSTASS